MEEKAQREGEKQVLSVLIEPLEALGLVRPSKATKADFELQKKELAQKLAYMSDTGLAELREWVEAHPGGKDKDRFPIALHILQKAHRIETPEAGPSPFILKVFATHHLVPEALAKGWAPELLRQVTAERGIWPGDWTCSKLRNEGIEHARRLEDIELRMSRGEQIPPDQLAFRDRRLAAMRRCQDIADQARAGRAA
ncbi:hypothetical protein [Pseudophaeobacter flagellatus]|uniref:hypothetical protein n=1 Tax=Pseudophaeobacter flagellatus TaxID=2899119 RepID=UPI001E36B5CC|nr:hypothetical protein [Pseudophaeobacter flagellatus]MCD9148506.1 hypothetical protein [Pseudophaeobacter flagellatus]